jgi:hypothetical protein
MEPGWCSQYSARTAGWTSKESFDSQLFQTVQTCSGARCLLFAGYPKSFHWGKAAEAWSSPSPGVGFRISQFTSWGGRRQVGVLARDLFNTEMVWCVTHCPLQGSWMTALFCVDKKQTRRDRLRRQNWLLQQKAIRVTGAAVCPAV